MLDPSCFQCRKKWEDGRSDDDGSGDNEDDGHGVDEDVDHGDNEDDGGENRANIRVALAEQAGALW